MNTVVKLIPAIAAVSLLTTGCGKKFQPEPTVTEQRLSRFDNMVAVWKDLRSRKKITQYRYRYDRDDYKVQIDVVGDEVVCRQKVALRAGAGPNIREVGEAINSHDWEGSKAYTLDEVHAECRARVAKDPYLPVFETMLDGYPYWCEGAFDLLYDNGMKMLNTSAELFCSKPLPKDPED